ncbi:MAG: GNAT family N-acetyltransferase [Anaerolineaceae bacterium]|nr:GNAT family N-acetyltransferase [Anaerolineaceae bacterium]
MTAVSGHVLDNPFWFSLISHHAHFASGTALVKAYPPSVFPMTTLVDHSDATLADFERLSNAGETTTLVCEANPPQHIPGWTIQRTITVDQMVCQQRVPQPETSGDIVDLNASHVPEIMELLEATHPLPFFPRSIELGHFIGIRQRGQLVATAGQRIWMTGYQEISTICTHPNWQGRGYARTLSSILVNEIWDNGETPFLHMNAHNPVTKHLYESLNFRTRCPMTILFLSPSTI